MPVPRSHSAAARPSRRAVLLAAVGGAGLTAFPSRTARAAELVGEGTTLAGTVVKASASGYGLLTAGPAEPHLVRTDLGVLAQADREARRSGLLAFAQLADIHLVDAQSPARVEYLDRYDDDPQTATLFSAAYRPHEMLTAQVADAVVRAVNAVGAGPVSRLPLAFAVSTGDNTDNCQANELGWHIGLMAGGEIAPTSGDPAGWEGVHDLDPASYDIHYWHPDGAPTGAQADLARTLYGFPDVPGLLVAAARTFSTPGLRRSDGSPLPWFAAYGNHDGLVQGNFPQSFQLGTLSTGPAKVISPPGGLSPADLRAVAGGSAAPLGGLGTGTVRLVTADAGRRIVSRADTVQTYLDAPGLPAGHGYTSADVAARRAYYAFDSGLFRCLVLDTVNPNGESNGSLDGEQFAWLTAQLETASSTRLTAPGGTLEAAGGTDRLVMVLGHHTLATMDNPLPAVDEPGPRVLGDQVRDLLLRYPNVVVMVDGHTHVNQVTPQLRPAGAAVAGGFWEINTASHVDFPCQARLVEVLDNHDGTLSIFGTVIDAAAPVDGGHATGSPQALASLARELAANDWQAGDRRGRVQDRNVELLVATPFATPAGPAAVVPEVPRAALLPVAGAAVLVGAVALRRRGERSSA